MSRLYRHEKFACQWPAENLFSRLSQLEGKVFRELPGRKTFKFEMDGNSYFAKLHEGIGWREIIKNLVQLRLPIVSARNEWVATTRLRELQVATMTTVAYGEQGWNPAKRKSYIVTEALLNTVSLEDFCLEWKQQPPNVQLKRKLIDKLATISRTLHDNGICHRDYYLCHFLMHLEDGEPGDDLRLSLIDLHRALIKPNLNRRWIVKDLAGLYYSAMHIGLTQRDLFRFVRSYQKTDLRSALSTQRSLWNAVNNKADAMFKKLGPNR